MAALSRVINGSCRNRRSGSALSIAARRCNDEAILTPGGDAPGMNNAMWVTALKQTEHRVQNEEEQACPGLYGGPRAEM